LLFKSSLAFGVSERERLKERVCTPGSHSAIVTLVPGSIS